MKKTEKNSITRIVLVLIFIALVMTISIVTERGNMNDEKILVQDTTYLFIENNPGTWEIVLKDSLANPDSTFSVKDGLIAITGNPFGYIRTKERYSDYNLFAEWRWPDEPGNSGVFLHVQEDGIWPVCLECQLMNQKAGDFVCFTGFEFAEHIDKEIKTVTKIAEVSEKPAGEWNTYDIRVENDSISIYVNGVLQNIATKTNFTEGHIALQSEGAPVEFRNVFLIQKEAVE